MVPLVCIFSKLKFRGQNFMEIWQFWLGIGIILALLGVIVAILGIYMDSVVPAYRRFKKSMNEKRKR